MNTTQNTDQEKLGADQEKLGRSPLGRLLMGYALPSIIAMTATSLYNMVDSIFIGQADGPLGLAGLTVCFPLMNLSAAFGAMVGIGAGTMTALKIGQRDIEGAEHTLGNVVMLNVLLGFLFAAISLLLLDPILTFFGASESSLPYAHAYMSVLLFGNILTHLYLGLNDVVRSSGYPRRAMIATLTAVGLNVLFDYVLIVLMDMGIRGAAIGTLLAQAVALCVVLNHLTSPTSFIHFKKGIFKWRPKIVRSIISIGSAPFFTNCCACLVVLLINNGLGTYGGDNHISAYGIANRLAFIFIMVTQGICQGMQPISGFNYGAGLVGRCIGIYRLAAIGGTIVMTCGFLLIEIFPRFFTLWFTKDETLIGITEHALRMVFLLFPLVGYQIVTVGFLLSIGRSGKAILLSLSRQLLCLTPLLIILPRFYGADGVWMAMPISDGFSVIVATILCIGQLRILRRMEAAKDEAR
ncbi:MAG: MATE family efflux transporter [Bacteroidales bacterium]|nr:MATE family efflux transporter [Bacteroidales bacterium]